MTKREYYELLISTSSQNNFPTQCYYRDGTGKKCVVGLLIPDETYNSCNTGTKGYFRNSLENNTVDYLPEWLLDKILPKGMTVKDLAALQTIHDDMVTRMDLEYKDCKPKPVPWDHAEFVSRVSKMECFKDCLELQL